MRELIPDPVTHPRSRNNYNNISHAKTDMFGLAQKLVTKCHNRLESTLYNRQGVGILFRGFLSVMSHGQWTHRQTDILTHRAPVRAKSLGMNDPLD